MMIHNNSSSSFWKMNRVNIIAVVLGVVNLVVAGPPVMRTVPTDTENVQESGLVALGAEDTALGSSTNRYIMWNKYSAGTSTCNLHDSGQKLDVKRIPHGCSGVAVSSPRLRAPHRFFILFLSSSSSSSSFSSSPRTPRTSTRATPSPIDSSRSDLKTPHLLH